MSYEPIPTTDFTPLSTCHKCAREFRGQCPCIASQPLRVPFVADKLIFPKHQSTNRRKAK